MLKIGEFAKLTGISIYMLRNYDKIGLLKPESIDDFTDYRYYSEKQIPEAETIQALKRLGFGLAEIKEILRLGVNSEKVQPMLNSKLMEKERELDALKEQLEYIRHASNGLARNDAFALSLHIKHIPERKIVSLRGVLSAFQEEGVLWERLHMLCEKYGVQLADTPYSFARTNSVDFAHERIDTEVWLQVEKLMPDVDELKFRVLPETDVAAIAYRGEYQKIGEISRYIYRWANENNYQISGKSFQTYYVSPAAEGDPNNYVTEVCFPVKKV